MNTTTLTFRIQLIGTEPWLLELSRYQQKPRCMSHTTSFKWLWDGTNSHLYQFNVGEEVIADTQLVDDKLGPVMDVKGILVTHVFSQVGTNVTYEYDLGMVGCTNLNWWRFPLG
jgi:hypothetical protein